MNKINTAKSKKALLIALICLATVAIVSVVYFASKSNSLSNRYQRQLDLGYNYLDELNYEQAVAAFAAAIEIDPKNPDAYRGLTDAYIVMDASDELPGLYELATGNLNNDELLDLNSYMTDGLNAEIKSAIECGDYSLASGYAVILSEINDSAAKEAFNDINSHIENSSVNLDLDVEATDPQIDSDNFCDDDVNLMDEEGSGDIDTNDVEPVEEIPLINMCTVNLYINGELWRTVNVQQGTKLEAKYAMPDEELMEDGYWMFADCWYTNPKGDSLSRFDTNSIISSDMNLYGITDEAVWEYYIDENGNAIGQGQLSVVRYGERFTNMDIVLRANGVPMFPSSPGKTFDGWYIDEECTILLDNAPDDYFAYGYYVVYYRFV